MGILSSVSLICQYNYNNDGNWFLHPTQQTIHERRIESNDTRGWRRNRVTVITITIVKLID